MKLNREGLKDKELWKKNDIKTPTYDIETTIKNTKENPKWIHFGGGNIFRGFIARLQDELLEKGLDDNGIIAAETFDFDIIDKIYKPYDNLVLSVGLWANGETKKQVLASICDAVKASAREESDFERLKQAFQAPSLQMASFTITEKGYALKDSKGNYFNTVLEDLENGPAKANHAMCITAALLLERFNAGQYPVAIVSMDNCSHNGEKLKASVLEVADKWLEKGFVNQEFIDYISDESRVSFPWSMIDKITPRPAREIEENLISLGLKGISPVITNKGTFIAPFVNAEIPEYLVIEDKFPNGRPKLEEAGVYFSDRDTVNKSETMKVTTCLNPLHTALAVYGCLLGYDSIAKEMKDNELKKLVEKIGYDEGIKVVVNPKIINPRDFIDEVINERLPNPFIPDSPARIATDTSQKVAIRFGETIKAYIKSPILDVNTLQFIPLAIAGWFRYLLGVDDGLKPFKISDDPMLSDLREGLKEIKIGNKDTYQGQLKSFLANKVIFGLDLVEAGLSEKIELLFLELIEDSGAVRNTLIKYLD